MINNATKEIKCVFPVNESEAILSRLKLMGLTSRQFILAMEDAYAAGTTTERMREISDIIEAVADSIKAVSTENFNLLNGGKSVTRYIHNKMLRLVRGEFATPVGRFRVDNKLYRGIVDMCKHTNLDPVKFVEVYSEMINIHRMSNTVHDETEFLPTHNKALIKVLEAHGYDNMSIIEEKVHQINDFILWDL